MILIICGGGKDGYGKDGNDGVVVNDDNCGNCGVIVAALTSVAVKLTLGCVGCCCKLSCC